MSKDLRIVFSGNDYRSVDAAVKRVLAAVKDTGNEARGPIPLMPLMGDDGAVRAVNRRDLTVTSPNHKMMPALAGLDLPSTVSVEMGG